MWVDGGWWVDTDGYVNVGTVDVWMCVAAWGWLDVLVWTVDEWRCPGGGGGRERKEGRPDNRDRSSPVTHMNHNVPRHNVLIRYTIMRQMQMLDFRSYSCTLSESHVVH